ncbi:L,D-transpeptidase [Edwardsiella ictaluri]|uniref:L,D-transpeptidase n=1 Tax=Edwardsiella ictaluri TaxID=67780 RepID=A0ABY8GGU8_EDWIC|nr:L,D-transpeptidase [Edwardsiella ictaluri]ELV7526778.1 L,D-transpeptidase [Edwardsiella ictaluri]KMQ78203.1 murein L,D-transpeptidase [Edwardsiella ictaluri]KOO55032.1 murein L,D-transpeptidase [Edwardsiella ictaluri]WFN96585.1 L,D-transpeptidase [Edwardsiella ictaluri]
MLSAKFGFRRRMAGTLLAVTLAPWGTPALAQTAPLHAEAAPAVSVLQAQLPPGITLRYGHELAVMYAAHSEQPMWQDSEVVRDFQQQLAELALSGVQPQFARWADALTDPRLHGMARDILLSDAMMGYLQYVAGVTANGDAWLYGNKSYTLAAPPVGLVDNWQRALRQGKLTVFIRSLAPSNPQYLAMRSALERLLADTTPWPQMPGGPTLRPGDSSPAVAPLREILLRSGAVPATDEGDGNVYTPALVAAVKRFQSGQGLTPDGVIGPRTYAWLNVTPSMRASLLALNIQRLRLLPASVHTGIMVNIPNFSMTYYRDGKDVLSSRVIVGRPARKTPLMNSELNNVVVNPPWNVPTKLVREDIVPKAMRDPGYFERHGYTLLSGWSGDVQVINPYMLDWSSVSARNFPYRVRQAPGAGNSLGRFKFNMPSQDAIYLHDTPNHALFNQDIRALSSGCVRINKASTLADMLLADAGWSPERVASALQAGNTQYVPIRQRIPVRLYYQTVWVSDGGEPQFRTDIYNYDQLARNGSRSVAQARQLFHL